MLLSKIIGVLPIVSLSIASNVYGGDWKKIKETDSDVSVVELDDLSRNSTNPDKPNAGVSDLIDLVKSRSGQ